MAGLRLEIDALNVESFTIADPYADDVFSIPTMTIYVTNCYGCPTEGVGTCKGFTCNADCPQPETTIVNGALSTAGTM